MSWDKSTRTKKTKMPSGLVHTWRLWRHCCCRYGWYPLLVAPIVTSGCVLSLYSSVGCDFVRVKVGFTPSNESWNQSTAELGLFHYQSGEPETNKYRATFHDGCRVYEEDFEQYFIDDDRTWKVARIMSYIAGVSSMVATTTAWLFVISPLPAFFFWPGVLLPALMAAFLSEGSKFLFFDTSICRNTMWYPSGPDSLPRVAESCELGTTGNYSIAGGAIFFLCLILVCLKAPEKRKLEPDYGETFEHEESDLESGIDRDEYGASEVSYGDASHDLYVIGSHDPDSYDDRDCSPAIIRGRSRTAREDGQEVHYTPRGKKHLDYSYEYRHHDDRSKGSRNHHHHHHHHHHPDDVTSSEFSDGREPVSHHKRHPSLDYRDDADDLIMARMKTLDSADDKYTAKPKTLAKTLSDDEYDDRYAPRKPPKTTIAAETTSTSSSKAAATAGTATASSSVASPDQRVSESRVHTIEKMELNTTAESEDMIEKFVTDLNMSFAVESPSTSKQKETIEPKEQSSSCQPLCIPSSAHSF